MEEEDTTPLAEEEDDEATLMLDRLLNAYAPLAHAYTHMLPTPCSKELTKSKIRAIVRPGGLLWGSPWDQRLRLGELRTHLGVGGVGVGGERWPALLFGPVTQILASSKRAQRQLIRGRLPGQGWVSKWYRHAQNGMCRGGVGGQENGVCRCVHFMSCMPPLHLFPQRRPSSRWWGGPTSKTWCSRWGGRSGGWGRRAPRRFVTATPAYVPTPTHFDHPLPPTSGGHGPRLWWPGRPGGPPGWRQRTPSPAA